MNISEMVQERDYEFTHDLLDGLISNDLERPRV